MSDLIVQFHGHRRSFPLTRFVTRITWSEGVSSPWDSMQVELSLPLGLIAKLEQRDTLNVEGQELPDIDLDTGEPLPGGYDIDPGGWLKLSEAGTLRVLAFGRVDGREISAQGGARGSLASRSSLRVMGAFQFLRTLACEFVPSISEGIGGILSEEEYSDYLDLVRRLLDGPTLDKVVGPDGLISKLAKVKIPSTLFSGVTDLAGLFGVAYDRDSGLRNAPRRKMDAVPVSRFAALSSVTPSGTVVDMILGMFQREPRLIELFPSMEASTNNIGSDGYRNARPVLIHRLCPWKTGPLSKMKLDSSGVPAAGAIYGNQDEPTWVIDKNTLSLEADDGYAITSTRTEQARVNAVTVNWSIAGGERARLLPLADLPFFDRKDIDRHGLKLMELNWDLGEYATKPTNPTPLINGRPQPPPLPPASLLADPDESPLVVLLRTIGLLAWHFYGLGHVFEVGTVEGPYLGLRARAGEPFRFHYGGAKPFTGYMTRVTHTVTRGARGEQASKTSIQFDRGLWDEDGRNPHLYYDAPPTTPANQPARPTQATMPGTCEVGLFLRYPSDLEDGDLAAFAGAGGSVFVPKIADRAYAYSAGDDNYPLELINEARGLGLVIEGWGFHYCETEAQAASEGTAAAQAALAHGCVAYYWDAEYAWAASSPSPFATSEAFLNAFRAVAPNVVTKWTSFSGDEYGGRKAMTPSLLQKWGVFAPQVYGDSRSRGDRIEKGIKIGVPVHPLFGSGRFDAKQGFSVVPLLGESGSIAQCRAFGIKRANIWYNVAGQMVANVYSSARTAKFYGRKAGDSISLEGPLAMLIPNMVNLVSEQ